MEEMETKSGRRAISSDWLPRKAKAIPSRLDRKNARTMRSSWNLV